MDDTLPGPRDYALAEPEDEPHGVLAPPSSPSVRAVLALVALAVAVATGALVACDIVKATWISDGIIIVALLLAVAAGISLLARTRGDDDGARV